MSNVEANQIDTRIANAQGEIDRELLTSTGSGNVLFRGYFNDGPLIEQLAPGENLQYLVENQSKGLEIEWANETETITPTGNYRTAALITDATTRIVIGQTDGDRVIEIPHSRVTDTSTESSLLRRTLTLTTAEATYRLPTTKDGDVNAIATHILSQHSQISEPQEADSTETPTATQTEDTATTEPDQSSEEEPEEEPIPTSGYWQLPARDAISTLDVAPATRIEAARRTLDDEPQASREQLIRAHSDLCRALEYTTPGQAGINTALNAVIDKIEGTLPERDAEQPSSESDNPSPARDDARDPASDTDTAATSSNNEATQNEATGGSTDTSLTPDPEPSESSTPPTSNADTQWRAALVRELQRLDETHDANVDRELVSRESHYEPVDYDNTFDSFEAALAEARIDTESASGETDVNEEAPGADAGFDFSEPSAASETAAEEIQPNELAELYEAFGMLQAVIDQLLPHLDPQSETASRKWYQAVYNHWTGEGPKDSTSYGDQQRERNDFSINDYRAQYGDDDRITEFRTIDTRRIEDVAHEDLDRDDLVIEAAGVIPIAPDSNTPLPVFVRTDAELTNALDLLKEFPAYPDANTPAPEPTEVTPELPEGRVDEVTVTVLEEYPDSGSKRDAWLSVRTDTGRRMPLVIWTIHEIDADWEVGATYTLYDARHKQWAHDDGSTTHELSSTSDLTIVQTGEPEAPTAELSGSKHGSTHQPHFEDGEDQANEPDARTADTEDTPTGHDTTDSESSDPPETTAGSDSGEDDEPEESDEPKDIVDRVLTDIDL